MAPMIVIALTETEGNTRSVIIHKKYFVDPRSIISLILDPSAVRLYLLRIFLLRTNI